MISDTDKQSLREFLRGKLQVEDNLTQDFVHGFASAAVWNAIENGMSPLDAADGQVAIENLVEEVLHSLRGGSIN